MFLLSIFSFPPPPPLQLDFHFFPKIQLLVYATGWPWLCFWLDYKLGIYRYLTDLVFQYPHSKFLVENLPESF